MSPAEDIRAEVVDALRRDLVGPMADPEGHYPRATPHILRPGEAAAGVPQLTIAQDGQEVLAQDSPVGRYLVGALYPRLTDQDSRVADVEQGLAPDDRAPGEDSPVPAVELGTDAAADVPDDETDARSRRTARPSAFGVTFAVRPDARHVAVGVSGGRYVSFPLAGRQGWHRVAVDTTIDVELVEGQHTYAIVDGGLSLAAGVQVREEADGRRSVTCFLRNRTPPGGQLSGRVLFGAQLSVTLPSNALVASAGLDRDPSPEAAGLRLLYAASPSRAVGHGVDVTIIDNSDSVEVRTVTMPVAPVAATTPDIGREFVVGMDDLARWSEEARAIVAHTISAYRQWIECKRTAATTLPSEHREAADRHLTMCESFLASMEGGWVLASRDEQVRRCLRWTSAAMAAQRRSYSAGTRRLTSSGAEGPEPADSRAPAEWRPFQLAFLLANLAPITDPSDSRRGVVDMVWMPTGGGKTEAYLGLAAFTMLYRRLVHARDGRGTAIIMRYTLRLLTAQQLQRAASLICALDLIRQENPDSLDADREFSIGAWLGRASTPNWHKDAIALRHELIRNKGEGARPFLLSRCPSCATEMGRVVGQELLGYRARRTSTGPWMEAHCPNPACRFHRGLPVHEVDESIYEVRPTFIVATVDKFAQLAWNEKVRGLFGISRQGGRGSAHQS